MRSKRAVRVAGLVVVLVVAGVTLHDSLPAPGQIIDTLSSAHPWWLVLAAVAELTSLRHFALQQRRLLAGFGVTMSVPRAVAVTYTRSAISFTLPAGSAVSAGFAFRQFRTAGASRRAAGAVAVLSSVLSGAALVLNYGVVVLLPLLFTRAGTGGTLPLVLSLLATGTVVFVLDWWLSRHGAGAAHILEETAGEPAPPGRVARAKAAVRRTLSDLRRLPPRSWVLSLLHATVNWSLDFGCLAATAAAFDVDVSLMRLATVYVSVQLVRQVPISPGGIGVVEVALLAGLVSAGAPQGPAAAAMLVYRLFSCWMIIPFGALAYAMLRRQPRTADKAFTPVG